MYPHERSLVSKLADQPFALLGINSDKDRENLKEVLEKEEITWRSWWDGGSTNGPIATAWRVTGWPTIYILDHKGVIRAKDLRGEKMEQAVALLLREARLEAKKQSAAKSAETAADKTPSKPASAADKPGLKLPEDKAKQDELASTRLRMARQLADDGKTDKARDRLQDLIKTFPKSPAAEEAKDLLKRLRK